MVNKKTLLTISIIVVCVLAITYMTMSESCNYPNLHGPYYKFVNFITEKTTGTTNNCYYGIPDFGNKDPFEAYCCHEYSDGSRTCFLNIPRELCSEK